MTEEALLVLEDGSMYRGQAFGFRGVAQGEVVFTTAMTGYQEMLTDPSYAGQIVVPTYPLIGNYGIHLADVESNRIQVAGFVVRRQCTWPSHRGSTSDIETYLADQGVPGISGLDTRSLTRRLRTRGVMMGVITSAQTVEEANRHLLNSPRYGDTDLIPGVSTKDRYSLREEEGAASKKRIVVLDFGLKYNILRILRRKGCEVIVCPARTAADQVLELIPDGVVLSPGPGDPEGAPYSVDTVRRLLGRVPLFGICLGHQFLGLAVGGKTYKLKFGHRGANHPVQDFTTGKIHVTAQNHGYALDGASLPSAVEVSHVSLNDGTVEGLRNTQVPAMSIQYHSEASPGPLDSEYLFDRFLELIAVAK